MKKTLRELLNLSNEHTVVVQINNAPSYIHGWDFEENDDEVTFSWDYDDLQFDATFELDVPPTDDISVYILTKVE